MNQPKHIQSFNPTMESIPILMVEIGLHRTWSKRVLLESAYFSVNTLLFYGQPALACSISQRMTIELEVEETFEKWRLDGRTFNPKKHPHIDYLRKQLPPSRATNSHSNTRFHTKSIWAWFLRCIVGGTVWCTATTSW